MPPEYVVLRSDGKPRKRLRVTARRVNDRWQVDLPLSWGAARGSDEDLGTAIELAAKAASVWETRCGDGEKWEPEILIEEEEER